MSPIKTLCGFVPVVKSALVPKEPAVIVPEVLMFLNTETVLLLFVTAKSGLPSPSRSPMAMLNGPDAVVKSTLVANEPAVMEPEVLVFLNTENVLLALLAITKSGLPSPSMSPIATLYGLAPVPAVKSTFEAKAVASIT